MTEHIDIHQSNLRHERRIKKAAMTILDQGEQLVLSLSANAYREKSPNVFNASIGGHYRHCLDHFVSVLRGLEQGEINYDARDRDLRVENDPEFARELTVRLRREIEALALETLALPVPARAEVSYAHGDSPVTASSAGRELAYAIAHAIHHYALISVIARLNGAALPEHFGMAPSTLVYQARQSNPTLSPAHVTLAS